MEIKRIVVGAYSVNCYILYNEMNKGFIIDPGGECAEITKFLDENKIEPEFIYLTHGHGDHIGAVNELKDIYKIPVYASEKEVELLSDEIMNLSTKIPPFKKCIIDVEKTLKHNEEIDFYGQILKIIETPGHTAGSSCMIVNDDIFTGDTLFKMSIGRSDLPTGDHLKITETIKSLKELPENMNVYPGHGAATTIKLEKMSNPFMK